MDSIDARTQVKAKTEPQRPIRYDTFEQLQLSLGGFLPPAGGHYGYAIWCHCLKLEKETLRKRIKEFGIPHITHGNDILMTPEDYLAFQPQAKSKAG